MLPNFIDKKEIKIGKHYISQYKNLEVVSLITGVGMLSTAYIMSKILTNQKFDIALNIGIAGLFSGSATIGDVFFIKKDFFPELGCGNDELFSSAFNKNLINPDEKPYNKGFLNSNFDFSKLCNNYKFANGITVNRTQMFNQNILPESLFDLPVLETMENAAFFYSCILDDLPCVGLRAVSNFTVDIDKNKWNIVLALNNLHKNTLSLLNEFSK